MRPPETFSGLSLATEPIIKSSLSSSDVLACYRDLYPRPITIQHWQLRDLVHCPYRAGEVFAVHHKRVLRHDLINLKSTLACDLSFEPTSVAFGSGYVAAGGQNSQLDIRRSCGPFENEIVFKGHCGGSVNNALKIAKDASHQRRLFICNNDDTVKIFSLTIGALVSMVRCPVAINHCALSPSGELMVCVGDNRNTYVYQATSVGYRLLHTYTVAKDAGMACDWSPSGSCFASASQDGLVCVWDARSEALVTKFCTPLACRNVKFSPSPLDLLAFSEHRGRCHIADSRVWSRQQIIHVSGVPDIEPDISGLCFSPTGNKLYVGREDCIMVYDIDTDGRRSFACAEYM